MWIADNWKDYTVIDTSSGEKLERWGKYTLIRPDPQVIWKTEKKNVLWRTADASYKRSRSGGGAWSDNKLPESWVISYGDLSFRIKPMGFKHTGLFPEQAANWDWFGDLIKQANRPIKVLNLFAYTGGATVAAAKAGAQVVHVDASKGMVAAAKENARLSGLADAPIRYIVDDCKKFIEREIRRGNKYDGIILDPPSYGRGPGGELWHLEEMLYPFMENLSEILSDKPLFLLLNSYTTGLQPLVLRNVIEKTICTKFGGKVDAQEVGLKATNGNIILPCGASGRWEG